jgi:hypothetical protein
MNGPSIALERGTGLSCGTEGVETLIIRSGLRLIASTTLTLGALVGSSTGAYANQINFLQVGHGGQVSVTTTASVNGTSGARTNSFIAGELNWSWIGAPPDGFAQSFYSYCVDVAQYLSDPQEVTVRSSAGFTNGVADGGAKAAWLVNQYAESIRSNADASSANIQAAALQVAIWEAMYDSTGNLGTGNFILNTTGAVNSQAQSYLAALYAVGSAAYTSSLATVLEVVSPDRGQDQIVSRVSEPSTILIMGVAFLVFASRARRLGQSH